MIIKEAQAIFGRLANEVIRFDSGFNIIELPNEGGKTTWCAFIYVMLFGLSADRDKIRYMPWSGSIMEGRLVVEKDGRDIEIVRRYDRSGTPVAFCAKDIRTGEVIEELNENNCGVKLCGCTSAEYAASVYAENGEISGRTGQRGENAFSPVSVIADAGRGMSKSELISRLSDIRNKIYSDEGRSGELADKLRMLSTVRKQACEVKNIYRLQFMNNAELIKAEKAYSEILKDLDIIDRHEEYCKVRTYRAAYEEIRELQGRASSNGVMYTKEVLDSISEQLNNLSVANNKYNLNYERSEQLCAQREALEAELMHKSGVEAEEKRFNRGLLMLVFPVAAAVLLVFSFINNISFSLPVFCLFVLLSFFTYKVYCIEDDKIQKEKEAESASNAEYQELLEKRRGIENDLSMYKGECTADKERIKSLIEILNKQFEVYGVIPANAEEAARLVDNARINLSNLNEAERRYRESGLELKLDIPEPLEDESASDLILPEKSRQELTELKEKTEDILKKRRDADNMLNDRASERKGISQLRSMENELLNNIARLKERLEAVELALEVAGEIDDESSLCRRIEDKASIYMDKLTSGKYVRVSVNDSREAMCAEGIAMPYISQRMLSKGMTDLLYLSLRLAVMDTMLKESRPAVILDDIFTNLDKEKNERVKKILKWISLKRGIQVILFTCRR